MYSGWSCMACKMHFPLGERGVLSHLEGAKRGKILILKYPQIMGFYRNTVVGSFHLPAST